MCSWFIVTFCTSEKNKFHKGDPGAGALVEAALPNESFEHVLASKEEKLRFEAGVLRRFST